MQWYIENIGLIKIKLREMNQISALNNPYVSWQAVKQINQIRPNQYHIIIVVYMSIYFK